MGLGSVVSESVAYLAHLYIVENRHSHRVLTAAEMVLLGVKHFPLCHLQFPTSSLTFPAINHHSPSPPILHFQPPKFPKIEIKKQTWVASKIHSSSNSVQSTEGNAIVKEKSVSVILLAGGKGKRMGASMPKQYLPLLDQPIALYSLYTFSQMAEVKEIVVVCDPSYRDIFEGAKEKIRVDLKFAEPGKERQDSVYSGLQAIDFNAELVCIHDSARPLVSSQDIDKVLKDAWLHGAAVLGVPAKATIKEADSDRFVVKTLDRKTLWEMQTPQVIKPVLLKEGFDLVNRKGLEVTDDVSIVEHLNYPVYITEGSYTNIKYSNRGKSTRQHKTTVNMQSNRHHISGAFWIMIHANCVGHYSFLAPIMSYCT